MKTRPLHSVWTPFTVIRKIKVDVSLWYLVQQCCDLCIILTASLYVSYYAHLVCEEEEAGRRWGGEGGVGRRVMWHHGVVWHSAEMTIARLEQLVYKQTPEQNWCSSPSVNFWSEPTCCTSAGDVQTNCHPASCWASGFVFACGRCHVRYRKTATAKKTKTETKQNKKMDSFS